MIDQTFKQLLEIKSLDNIIKERDMTLREIR